MKATRFFCCIVLLGTVSFGHGVGVKISSGEARSGPSEPTLVETLKAGKEVPEESLIGELVEKGEKEMAKNLKDGKAESWESIEKALNGRPQHTTPGTTEPGSNSNCFTKHNNGNLNLQGVLRGWHTLKVEKSMKSFREMSSEYIREDVLSNAIKNKVTIYKYNCGKDKFKNTGLCKDILSGENGGMCEKKDCDAFDARGDARGAVQTFTNEDGKKFDLTLKCHWDQKRGPVYSYGVKKRFLFYGINRGGDRC